MGEKLKVAREFLREGEEMVMVAREKEDAVLMRNACEKLWGAVIQAVDDLIEFMGKKLPESHRERREILAELGRGDKRIIELGLRERLGARAEILHEGCFYGGVMPEDIDGEIEKVRRFIRDVEELEEKSL